jgi:hypothetical protein
VRSKVTWDRTLAYFAKLAAVEEKADQTARRLATNISRFTCKQI